MNNALLKQSIKRKLVENNMSVSALERVAGLKQSAVQNILNGRSKRPSMLIIQAVSDALGCSISELLGEKEMTKKAERSVELSDAFHGFYKDAKRDEFMKQDWDLDYYLKCVALVHELQKDKHLSKSQFDRIVEEIYYYSYRDGLDEPDQRYARRLLETAS